MESLVNVSFSDMTNNRQNFLWIFFGAYASFISTVCVSISDHFSCNSYGKLTAWTNDCPVCGTAEFLKRNCLSHESAAAEKRHFILVVVIFQLLDTFPMKCFAHGRFIFCHKYYLDWSEGTDRADRLLMLIGWRLDSYWRLLEYVTSFPRIFMFIENK